MNNEIIKILYTEILSRLWIVMLSEGGFYTKLKKSFFKIFQTVSLHESMSINENLFFYGYIFGLSSKDIQARAIDLITLLDLPSGNRIVGDLR